MSHAGAKFDSEKKKKIFFQGRKNWKSLTTFTGLVVWISTVVEKGKREHLHVQKKSKLFFSDL
jgi:hypothetical protein